MRNITIEQAYDGKYDVWVEDETHPRGRALYAMVNSQEEAEAEKERANIRYNYRCDECGGDVRRCDCVPF